MLYGSQARSLFYIFGNRLDNMRSGELKRWILKGCAILLQYSRPSQHDRLVCEMWLTSRYVYQVHEAI